MRRLLSTPKIPLVLTLVALSSCGPDSLEAPEGSLLREPLQALPERFSEVGLYPVAPDFSVPAQAVPYEPVWPLWSNGSAKRRYIVIPKGETIDTRVTPWVFPAGTLLFKTFLYTDDSFSDGLRPIETRLMRLDTEGTWDYATYRWNGDGSEATLVDPAAPDPVPVSTEGEEFVHTIPAKLECRTCHESREGEVLGFEALQLGDQLDVLGGKDLFAETPATAAPIDHDDPVTRELLGRFYGDCVHCHNGGDGPSSSFDLRPDVALENTIGVMTASSASAFGIRIVPGDPAASILFQSYSGETSDSEVKLMPPVGVDVRDDASIELLRGWILNLNEDS